MKEEINTIQTIQAELELLSDNKKKEILPRFFKTGKGQYGEGDRFIGVITPNTRSIAKKHLETDLSVISEILTSPWHEMRLCGLFILVEQFKQTLKHSWIKGHSAADTERLQEKLYNFYLAHTESINNWDLVDLTAPTLVGEFLWNKDRSPLYRLAESSLLWEQRIAVVSTITFIRRGDCKDIYLLAVKLMHHRHDLMHKAIGWMLREAGKQDKEGLEKFLDKHVNEMPRTMLRYSIEKFSDEERQDYLHR